MTNRASAHGFLVVRREARSDFAERLQRIPIDHYVIWTGHPRRGPPSSRIGRCMAHLEDAWTPVSLRRLVQRMETREPGSGLSAEALREALRQHQRAQPAVLLLVRRLPTGAFAAIHDVPSAAGGRRFQSGETILPSSDVRFSRWDETTR